MSNRMRFFCQAQRYFLQGFLFIGIVTLSLLLGCGGGDSDDTAGIRIPNPDTEEEEKEEQVAIEGVLAIAQSSENESGRLLRQISGGTIDLLTANREVIATTTTSSLGEFALTVQTSEENLPLTLESTIGETTYSSAIPSLEEAITININDITTRITQLILMRKNQSEININRIARLVMMRRFGLNKDGNLNIPPKVFLTEDFRDSSSLGNVLLEASASGNVSLIGEVDANESLLANRNFLKFFFNKLRKSGNPQKALNFLKALPGSEVLVEKLTAAVNADTPEERAAILEELRSEVLSQVQEKQTQIEALEAEIENAE